MRRVFSRTRSEAPFLFSERGSLALTRTMRHVGGGAADFGDEDAQSRLELRGTYEDRDLAGRSFSDCQGSGGAFVRLALGGSAWSRCHFRSARFEGTTAPDTRWDVVDLERATITELAAPGASFSLTSFRDATLRGCALTGATFVLCDFSGTRLDRCSLSGARFVGCDFEGAIFEATDASGADLRSSTFRGAWLAGLTLDGAQVAGADFRHASAIPAPALAQLKQGGARLGGGYLYAAWAKLLVRDGNADGHRRTLRAVTGTWALLAILIPVLFFARAVMNPVSPDYGPNVEDEEPAEEPLEGQ